MASIYVPQPYEDVSSQPYLEESKKRKLVEATEVFSISADSSRHSKDALRKIISFLSEEQATNLLFDACLAHPDVLSAVSEVTGKSNSRKVFVRGLGYDVTNDDLRAAYEVYGEVEDALVISEKGTNRSRGFGFITFRTISGCLSALSMTSKEIKGRNVNHNLAAQGAGADGGHGQSTEAPVNLRKIYIGNVPQGATADAILSSFSKFGEIEEGPIGLDRETKLSRGFALILYKTPDSASRAVEEPNKEINGRPVYCKLATDGGKAKAQSQGQMIAASAKMIPQAIPPPHYISVPGGLAQVNQSQPASIQAQGHSSQQYILAGASGYEISNPSAQQTYPRPLALSPVGVYPPPPHSQSPASYQPNFPASYVPGAVPGTSSAQVQSNSSLLGQAQVMYSSQGQPGAYEGQQVVIQPGQYVVTQQGTYGVQGQYQ